MKFEEGGGGRILTYMLIAAGVFVLLWLLLGGEDSTRILPIVPAPQKEDIVNEKPDLNKVRIEVSEQFLKTFGTGTLTGTLAGHMTQNELPKAVVLVFPETSLGWRTRNDGPKYIIVTEYAIRLLLEDVSHLRDRGINISFETVVRDP